MKFPLFSLLSLSAVLFIACGNSSAESASPSIETKKTSSSNEAFYFEYSIDGKPYRVKADDILTTYNSYQGNSEFKIFAGGESGPQLLLTIPHDMSKPSSTDSGSPEAGSSIAQGSVSLQDYPNKGDVLNSYDFMTNPKPKPTPNAIVVTSSEQLGEEGRIIAGTLDVTVVGENSSYKITGKFSIKHLFKGEKF